MPADNLVQFLRTNEQIEIIESVQAHKLIKINAFAGTGKTSTLQHITTHYGNKTFLYFLFSFLKTSYNFSKVILLSKSRYFIFTLSLKYLSSNISSLAICALILSTRQQRIVNKIKRFILSFFNKFKIPQNYSLE